jgi:peptidoglycan/LPS O-acetylase OafA/YrhL
MSGSGVAQAGIQRESATGSRHVHEVDVVRVLTFACVIAVHTTSHTNPGTSVSANAVVMLLHFTREAFFFLTAFVLIHQYIGRTVDVANFYRRRLLTVGVPYLTWTVLYSLLATHESGQWSSYAHTLVFDAVTGTAWYHLYFLLVSMQIYLLYPLLARLVRATAGRHGRLLLASGVLQLALLSVLMYAPPDWGWITPIITHEDAIFLPYQFYIVAGAVAAFHLAEVRAWVSTHRPGISGFVLASGLVTLAWYFTAERNGRTPIGAAAVLQPVMLLWSVAAIAGLFALGSYWAQHRTAGSGLDRALEVGSDRSFGVFLVHPMVLWFVLEYAHVRQLSSLPLTVAAYSLTVLGSLVAVELFRRLALSLPLTGRPRLRRRRHAVIPQTLGKDADHAHHDPGSAVTTEQAARRGRHDGDGRRVADEAVHRRRLELQRPHRRDEAGVGNLAGD